MSNSKLIKELRERTSAGFMDCKKALDASAGDVDAAIDFLKKSGAIKSAKTQGNTAAEGTLFLGISDDKTFGVLLEVNCQTDFVAKSQKFLDFVQLLGNYVISEQILRLENLMKTAINGKNVESLQNDLILSLGEKIRIRRLVAFECQEGLVGGYLHHGRIASVVNVITKSDQVLKDIAMHVVACKPTCLNADDVPDELLKKERTNLQEQMKDSDKPPHIVDQIIEGRLQKFVDEVSLYGQPFAKDSKIKVSEYLNQNNSEALGFVCMTLGEGIEKEMTDFAEEVAKQLG